MSNYIQISPERSKKLIKTIYSKKEFELLKILIPEYFDVNLPIENEKTLLVMASYRSDSEMMIYLFKKGATINYKRFYINDEFISKLLETKYHDIFKVIHEGKYFRKYDRKDKYNQQDIIFLHTIYYENFELFNILWKKLII